MEEGVLKYFRLRNLCENFHNVATLAGQLILTEYNPRAFAEMDLISGKIEEIKRSKDKLTSEDIAKVQRLVEKYERIDGQFTLKRARVGGRAGGHKYFHQGIYFKLAS